MFHTAEIRWFSQDEELLSAYFDALPGRPYIQEERTDHYLKSSTFHTGIKLRSGLHEIKVKSAENMMQPYGQVEVWTKWSHSAYGDIRRLLTQSPLTEDWIPVRKQRIKKMHEIHSTRLNEMLTVGIELGEIDLLYGHHPTTWYTLSFETYEDEDSHAAHLIEALSLLNIDKMDFSDMLSMGYPQFLSTVLASS